MCTQKMRALSYIGAEKIKFPPKPDRQTYRLTDICFYRVASLLKRFNSKIYVCDKITDNMFYQYKYKYLI